MESVPSVACPVHGGGGAAAGPSGSASTPLSPALALALADPSLGESLLDPPQSYRSPPRIVHPDEQGMLIRRSRVLAEGECLPRWAHFFSSCCVDCDSRNESGRGDKRTGWLPSFRRPPVSSSFLTLGTLHLG